MSGEGPLGQLPRELARAAERVLRRRIGGSPRIAQAAPMAGRAAFRCRVEGRGAPDSVIVKTAGPQAGDQEQRGRHHLPGSASSLLSSEWVALELLDALQDRAGGPRVAPHLYGGDLGLGVLVVEDLGEGPSLADALLGDDPLSAEVALVAFARSLGRMHALSSGREADHAAALQALGRPPARAAWQASLRDAIARVPATFDELEFEWSPGLVDDVQQVAAALLSPGPFDALVLGGVCPEDVRVIGGQAVLGDFERSGFHNCMVDGAYGRVPFPTCGCANRLPAWLVARFENAYRLELVRAVPEVEDDATFERGLMEAAGYWLLRDANALLGRALRLEERWGIATYRQRLLFRFQAFAQASARSHQLEALGAFAYLMGERMRALWPEVQEMPPYPAFR
jgi:hypothetical protein